MKPYGCPHSDCARCNGTVAKLEAENKRLKEDRDDWEGRYMALYDNGPLMRLRELAKATVEALRGSGGLDPKGVEALRKLEEKL